jgi:hypothetical protein
MWLNVNGLTDTAQSPPKWLPATAPTEPSRRLGFGPFRIMPGQDVRLRVRLAVRLSSPQGRGGRVHPALLVAQPVRPVAREQEGTVEIDQARALRQQHRRRHR